MSKLKRNIIYNIAGQCSIIVLSVFTYKQIFEKIGSDVFGIIQFTVLINLISIEVFELGINRTAAREISAYYKSDPQYIKGLIRTASLFYWAVFIALSAALFMLAPSIIDKWVHIKTLDRNSAIFMLRVMGITSLLVLPNALFKSILGGIQRMEFQNAVEIIISLFQQLGLIYVLILTGDLMKVIYWYAGCFIAKTIIFFLISARFFSFHSLLPGFSPEAVKRNYRFALNLTAINLTSVFQQNGDKFILSKLQPISVMGYYNFAANNIERAKLITNAISQAAYPSFSEIFATGNHEKILTQYRKLQELSCYTLAPLVATIPFAILPVFSYMFGAEVAKSMFLPSTLLAVALIMGGTLNVPNVFALAVGKPQIAARLNFYALFTILPLTVFLIYYFGLIGAGLSNVFYWSFAYVYGMPRICRQCLLIPVWEWYWHVFRIFLLIGLTYGVAWFAQSAAGGSSIVSLAAGYIAATIAYSAIAYFMICDELKEEIKTHLAKLKFRAAHR
ncbi:MAG: oligosaccharide flippase family protein [bacterium]